MPRLAPRGEELRARLRAAQRVPRARHLAVFLDLVARHLGDLHQRCRVLGTDSYHVDVRELALRGLPVGQDEGVVDQE